MTLPIYLEQCHPHENTLIYTIMVTFLFVIIS